MAVLLLRHGRRRLVMIHRAVNSAPVWVCLFWAAGIYCQSCCPTKTDRAPATEIADRPGRSVGAASRQARGEGQNFGYCMQVLRLPCAFLRLPCAFHHLARFRDDGERWGAFSSPLSFLVS